MVTITLPDSSTRAFDAPPTAADVARSIGAGLAKAAIAARVNGEVVDLTRSIEADAQVAILTAKDEAGLEVLRHSCAHALAQAVKRLFPSAQVTIGPVIEHGFYYDFSFERPFTPEDLAQIESEMRAIQAADLAVSRSVLSRDDAVAYFRGIGELYKAEIIEGIPSDEPLSLYSQGEFTDLCRGPHIPSTGKLPAFKLMRVSGAYWRGDHRNEMLQRIYGVAFADDKALKAHLDFLEEAEKRDHRRIGRQLDLFHLQEEAPGMIFWHPNGWTLWQQVEQYMRRVYQRHGYAEVRAPVILDRTLWEKSGHWSHFKDHMFITSSENRDYAVKPMNCPGHVQIYNSHLRSYRDLPIRYGEFGACHRNEPSGALSGIMRVRAFTQDDGHIFCTEGQIQSEVARFIEVLLGVYRDFGFNDILYKLATRPAERVGAEEAWDKAEQALAHALDARGLPWIEVPGEGAFYGPKIEFSLKDALGRVWQCGTIQVDFSMPGRLGAEYVDEHSQRRTPVMLHRAILGSFERFIGILLEHYSGLLPPWLAPLQAVVLNITDDQAKYADEVAQELLERGLRVRADLRNEKLGYKIREHTLARVPYLLVAGGRERDDGTLSVRTRSGNDLGTMTVAALADLIESEVARRSAL